MSIVEFVTPTGQRLLINTRRESISLMVDESLTLNYDREGRLIGAWIEGRNYRRSNFISSPSNLVRDWRLLPAALMFCTAELLYG